MFATLAIKSVLFEYGAYIVLECFNQKLFEIISKLFKTFSLNFEFVLNKAHCSHC